MAEELEEIVIENDTKCADCGKLRTNEPDYSPLQAMTTRVLGWYSGHDGELCPDDIAKLMNMGNSTGIYSGWKI